MSYLIQKDYVRYECTCGTLTPISNLYFCRHCLQLRCCYCVYHEVDSHYCNNCMEHLPPSEAKLKKNRCATCFDCPNCFHTLSVRATSRSADDSGSSLSKTPSKHYYLACFFCRWTTRDVGISDQSTAAGNWPVNEDPNVELLNSYLDHYKLVAMREKNQKEQKDKKTLTTRRYTSFSEKFGLTAMIARKRAGLPPLPLAGNELNSTTLPPINPCVAVEDVDPLPESYFTEVPDLTKITTIPQRHSNTFSQPARSSDLSLQHRHFGIKKSMRCRACEHNVSKPEYNPSSIRFKIQLSAYYHMPEIKVMSFEPFKSGEKSEIVIKITNPTQYLTSLQFNPLFEKFFDKSILPEEPTNKKQMQLRKPRHQVEPNTKVDLPTGPVVLPPRDDAAEYDDASDTHNFQDDPKVVVWRKGNKTAVKFSVTPDSSLKLGDLVTFVLSIEYGYLNTMPTLEQKQAQRVDMNVNLYISPGEIVKTKEKLEKGDS